jgi:hypothetical protein
MNQNWGTFISRVIVVLYDFDENRFKIIIFSHTSLALKVSSYGIEGGGGDRDRE